MYIFFLSLISLGGMSMKITTTGRKVNLKDAFLDRVTTKLEKLDKFFTDTAEAQVTVKVEKSWQTVEITIRDKGFMVRAEKEADRMEDAFDNALDILTQRIIKSRKRMDKAQTQPIDLPVLAQDEADEHDEPYHIIREKHFSVKPCGTEEAILEMELLGHAFYMFRDADSDEINVVYKRKNGSYGLLIPEK